MSEAPFVVLDNVAKRWNGQLGVENENLGPEILVIPVGLVVGVTDFIMKNPG